MGQIPNIDYIGTVENDSNGVVFKKYPIEVDRALLKDLEKMREDAAKTVMDMQELFLAKFPNEERGRYLKDFLAPIVYKEAFVENVVFPPLMSRCAFVADNDIVARQAGESYDSDVAERLKKGLALPRESREARVAAKIATWILDHKRYYYAKAKRFIYSNAYYQTLKNADITHRSRPDGDVKMFTTDNIGWTTYYYKISQDVSIRFDSNFGYGKDSYFHLGLIYKGLELFPYSAYVRYYYANWRTLLAHTWTFDECRASWDAALNLVVKHANWASSDPEGFVKGFILGEVRGMVNELREIASQKFNGELNPFHATRTKYLGVSAPDKGTVTVYEAYPKEECIAYKAEKISGALTFLGKLRQLFEIHEEVKMALGEIVDIVKNIIPEIDQNMAGITSDVNGLEKKLDVIKCQKDYLQNEIARMDHEILTCQQAALLIKATQCSFGMVPANVENELMATVRNLYLQQHPEYVKTANSLLQAKTCYCTTRNDLVKRKRFLKRLRNCKFVAVGADEYSDLVARLRVHEIELDRRYRERLSDKDEKEINPRKIKEIRNSEQRRYAKENAEYASLIAKRNSYEEVVDAFEIMCV